MCGVVSSPLLHGALALADPDARLASAVSLPLHLVGEVLVLVAEQAVHAQQFRQVVQHRVRRVVVARPAIIDVTQNFKTFL